MITLGASELARLRSFVRDVYDTIQNDVEGITYDLEDDCLIAGEILKIVLTGSSNNDGE